MYIKDLQSGEVRRYGTNHHDALRVSPDGKMLFYENLQNGDGSLGDYRFCDEDGLTPEEDEDLMIHGADAYFNIGGFWTEEEGRERRKILKKWNEELLEIIKRREKGDKE